MMRTLLHLKPGQKGTKQLLAQYGDRLVCVRYRYDAQRKKRFKTVELSVAERDHAIVAQLPDPSLWIPRPTGLLHPLADGHVGKGDA